MICQISPCVNMSRKLSGAMHWPNRDMSGQCFLKARVTAANVSKICRPGLAHGRWVEGICTVNQK